MSHRTVPLKLVPAGLVVDRHEISGAGITVHAHSASPTSDCPACGLASSSIHSRYGRSLGDLPAHGRCLRIRLSARRFRCRNAACERRVFTERFAPDLIQAHARRTSRLDVLTHAIALALGGRPGERLTKRLAMPVGADTLLRLLRRRATPTPSDVRVVGIDDFAWRKGQCYGTIICDLERRCTVDLLPDREGGSVADWLAAHPGVEIVCCDRGSGYRDGATRGAPKALQIPQGFPRAPDLGRDRLNRRLERAVLAFVILDHPDRSLADLWGKWGCALRHGLHLTRSGASGKPGAVQFGGAPTRTQAATFARSPEKLVVEPEDY